MNYAYLVASFPAIAMDAAPALRMSTFREDAQRLMSEEDWAEVEAVLADRPEACRSAVAREWFQFERDLRHRVAAVRAGRLKLDSRTLGPQPGGADAVVKQAVLDAFARTNPMERELQLDQTRWRYLDDLARREPFGLGSVLTYALQLRLAERWSGHSVEAGTKSLDRQLKTSLANQHVEAA